MKHTLLILCCLLSLNAFSQITYLADTAFYTDIGYGGAPASCKANDVVYNGWNMTRSNHVWLAQSFTVPAGSLWKFDTVVIYGYQYGSPAVSTFTGAYLQIYNGTPGAGGSVTWGDSTTNLLKNTGWTGIYKVDTFVADNGLMNTYRPIMYLSLYLSPHPVLTPGTYWLSWSTDASMPTACVCPDKVLPGRINPPAETARGSYGGVWDYLKDNGHFTGLDMMIKGSASLLSAPQLAEQAVMLGDCIPNPAAASTEIPFYLPGAGYAKLTVYNTLGQLIRILADGNMAEGWHSATFVSDNMPRGTYYYRLQTAAGAESKQFILMK